MMEWLWLCGVIFVCSGSAMFTCKTDYVDRLSEILQVKISVNSFYTVSNNNISHPHAKRNRIVSISPQRDDFTIDTAMLQLNISSTNGVNCQRTPTEDINIWQDRRPVYLSNFFETRGWEAFLTVFPNSKYIVSKPNEEQWLKHQLESKSCKLDTPTDCLVPVPFSSSQIHREHNQEIRSALLAKGNLKTVSLTTLKATFEAYYTFVQCLIPPKQLHWISLPAPSKDVEIKRRNSEKFWGDLIAFTHLKIPKYTLSRLVLGGIPYPTAGNCYLGEI